MFKLKSDFSPAGDQPQAIEKMLGDRPGKSLLLGVTGSGKTFSLANVIAGQDRQVLIISPNKTLAAQLYEEFSLFFPENKVCYFVSYYDYYQPESYMPSSDTYIAKETKINDQIERLRIEATASLVNRNDTIVIASVSAIYSLGNPEEYRNAALGLKVDQKMSRKKLLAQLIDLQYKRNDHERTSGTFQVHGGTITVNLPYIRDGLRIELFGDVIESLELIDPKNYTVKSTVDNIIIFPARHFVVPEGRLEHATHAIQADLKEAVKTIENPLYKQRLKTRIGHDVAMLRSTGFCSGIENYSRYFEDRAEGSPPYCLFDFFQQDFLLIIDESHISVPQMGAMYRGDKARKKSLIDYGFRLPSAYDNRPLKFEEVERYFDNMIFVSATPGEYEKEHATIVAEQVVRPTGIIDPSITVREREGQLDDLMKEIKATTKAGFRTLVTTLTKKSSEALALYLENEGIKACYLHSEIKTPERSAILAKLREGIFDCLIGINLLREGLDLPEVALVAVLDADVEGFLRNERSLIQTIGRAARNAQSRVIFYADRVTKSMQAAIDETTRRQKIQRAFNKKHGIIPKTTHRAQNQGINLGTQKGSHRKEQQEKHQRQLTKEQETMSPKLIEQMKREMMQAAEKLDFEKAIALREKILQLQNK